MIYVLALIFLLIFSYSAYRVGLKVYLKRVLVSFDQLLNVLFFGGYEDEQLSSAAYRLARERKYWYSAFPEVIINFLFFWESDHCKKSYEYELARLDLHISMRSGDGRNPTI